MIYYPKAKILENQFTSGKEFVFSKTGKPYTGYYYALSNNKFYSGKTSEDPNTQELIKILKDTPNSLSPSNSTQLVTTGIFMLPVPYYPIISESDYKLGFISRYFVKRRNADYTTIREISPNDYKKYFTLTTDDLDTNLYAAVKINWKISGPINDDFSDRNNPKIGIINTNKKMISLKEVVFPGFSLFFKDYSQFAKPI